MLPDVWRMAHRRARARRGIDTTDHPSETLRHLGAGVEHHLLADDWFHAHPVFVSAVAETAEQIDGTGIRARKMRLLAHPLVEIALDGALIDRLGLERLLGDLGRARESAELSDLHELLDLHAPEGSDNRGTTTRTATLLDQIVAGPWIAGYRDAGGLADRLGGLRRRLELSPVEGEDRPRLEAICQHAIDAAPDQLAVLEHSAGRRPSSQERDPDGDRVRMNPATDP